MAKLACAAACLALLLVTGCAQRSGDPGPRPPGPAYDNGDRGGGGGGDGGGGSM